MRVFGSGQYSMKMNKFAHHQQKNNNWGQKGCENLYV